MTTQQTVSGCTQVVPLVTLLVLVNSLLLETPLLMAADAVPRNETPLNFVVIMADDLGYADISCFGNPTYRTPHLDRLAAEGIKLTDFHSNGSVCSPTRAALLTGRYQQRAGIDGVVMADPQHNRHHGLQPEEVTFAETLQQAGYAMGIFGKWHLGYEVEYNPIQHGFAEFRGYVSGNICYQSHLDRMGFADWWQNDKLVSESGYCTHLITRHAVEFLKSHKNHPFCLYVAHESVHSPFQGPDDPPVRVPGKVGEVRSATVKDIPRAYQEMITEMDLGIGEIVEQLRVLGLEKNTLVLFFSDNGATKEGSNAPWKGNKGSLWEGGHRVPFIAWQPGKISPGKDSPVPAMTIDIMPTLLDLANVSASPEKPLDGVSLKSVFYADQSVSPALIDRDLFWSYRDQRAMRVGNWKLIATKSAKQKTSVQLYNLQNDPQEATDLKQQEPQRVVQLSKRLQDWEMEISTKATIQPSPSK